MTDEQRVDTFLELLADLPRKGVVAGWASPPSKRDLDRCEKNLLVTFPGDYKALILRSGCLIVTRADALESATAASIEEPGFIVLGLGEGVDDEGSVIAQARAFRDYKESPLVPLARWMGSGNAVCVDESGRLVDWDEENEQESVLDQSFLDVLLEWIDVLRQAGTRG